MDACLPPPHLDLDAGDGATYRYKCEILGYFLGDTKAVLKDCVDHWVLQGRAAVPLLYQMTVCVDIRVVVPGAWVAFSYSSGHAPRPELGLEGDETALYGWLLRVQHRFPVKLEPALWHRVCLRRDVGRNSFSLEVDGLMVAERTVIAQASPSSSGSLWLGCRPRGRPPGPLLGELELYLFRVWADVDAHGFCEDGGVIGWDSQFWGVTSGKRCPQPQEPRLSLNPPASLRAQTIEVSCDAKQNGRHTSSCGVLLQLRRAAPVCSLQLAALSALQRAANQHMRARLTGELERVAEYHTLLGRGLCEDGTPSGGGVVSSVIDPTNIMTHTPTREPCFGKEPRFCDCSAFCSDTRQFFALSVNISSSVVDVAMLQSVGSHLECHGTKQRLYSCMVILEMLGPVDVCSLTRLLQLHMDSIPGVTEERPLARMVVCGPAGLPVSALLTSNLTWVASDLLTSEICRPNRSLLNCEGDETLAVLLTESCQDARLTAANRTLQPSSLQRDRIATTAATAATPSVTDGTLRQNATAETVTQNTTLENTTSTVDATTPTQAPQLNNNTTNYATNVNNTDSNMIYSASALNTTEANFNWSSNSTTLKTNGQPYSRGLFDTFTIFYIPTHHRAAQQHHNTDETTQDDQDEPEQEAEVLLDQLQKTSNLTSSQVEEVVARLEKLLKGPAVSRSLGEKVLKIISKLMEGDSAALSTSGNRLIRLVESLGIKLVVTDDSEILSSHLLVLAVRPVDGTNFPTTSVNIFSTDHIQFQPVRRSPPRSWENPMGRVLLPSSLTEGLNHEEQRQASRVQFTFFTSTALFQDPTLKNRTVAGPVLGSSVANLSISNLSENIQFTIRNINPANCVASCVFWDFELNGGGGGWNPNGCSVLNATEEETTCSCNHLTSFAILLDVSRQGVSDRQQALVLTFITYIGCGISAVLLAVTLLTYLSFEKLLRDIPSKILVQLCFSLLFLNLVFLLDGWLALYPATGLCISTGFFLHYFLLTSFTWAGLEALHMYLSIVRVFTPYLSRYMLKFSLLGWGLPLVVVVVVIAVDKNNYGLVTYGKYSDGTTDDFCWLRNDVAFYVGVVAYFLLIFFLCLVVFIVVLVQLQRIKRQNPQNQAPNRGLLTELRSVAGLIVLLGLTWGFALLAWGPLHLPFVYLFAIFNSLQGVFIFALHCAVKENVRRQWKTFLCCGRLRLGDNSYWSRTATHKMKKLSVLTSSTTPVFGPASRSSSVISEGTSSGLVFSDSGMSDGSSSDVVLNEIHRRSAAGPPSVASYGVRMDL
ncbi:uncharacterized protein adgrg2a [Genypterus blacodes]|uniref:uncharacterized protein adgrg2a n=1 Tax=Genypterus blacodes TaxID=154954 RepID=UPI003F75E5C6